jgi:hypothetical protein
MIVISMIPVWQSGKSAIATALPVKNKTSEQAKSRREIHG